MATWPEIQQEAPEFSGRVRALFQSGTTRRSPGCAATARRGSAAPSWNWPTAM
jgi:hypothetical protein